MPRGPGRASNYNLDYSRFNGVKPTEEQDENEEEVRSDIPSMREMLRRAPPELREAHHLLVAGRANGDQEAERRANELVLQAMKKASPEVQKDFVEELARHEPQAAATISAAVGAAPPSLSSASPDELGKTISTLRQEMEQGAEATRKQLEGLQEQQERLERLKSPEDILRFMHEHGGMGEEDLRRIFSGDTEHMERCMTGMLDRSLSADGKKVEDSEKAVVAAEQLHNALLGKDMARPCPPCPATEAPALEPEPEEEVKIPDHRLQYEKDEQSRYTAVKLRCTMPGVCDMSGIFLDVSEKHIRLHTCAPAPKYAVNAGPFPILIDPSCARAKFSRRREELSVEVPAKAED